MTIKKAKRALVLAAAALAAVSCSGPDDAQVVSQNLSTAADNFEINRKIIFLNSITDHDVLVIEGRCSLTDQGTQLEVVCKVGDNSYKKHFLGLSDNMTYVSEQVDGANASPYHYRVTIKPQALIPSPDVRAGR